MNVKQLRNLLLDYPDDLEILIASDEEGNEFNRLLELGRVNIYKNDDKHGSTEDVFPEIPWDENPDEFELRLVLWP